MSPAERRRYRAEERRKSDEFWARIERRRQQRSYKAKAQVRCPITRRFEKPLPNEVVITDELQGTARHEAAHAIVEHLGPDRLRGITVIPHGTTLGQVFTKKRRVGLTNKSLLEAACRKRILGSLAGPIADYATGREVHYMGDVYAIASTLAELRGEHDSPIPAGLSLQLCELGNDAKAHRFLADRAMERGLDNEMLKKHAQTFCKLVEGALLWCATPKDMLPTVMPPVIERHFPDGLSEDDRERLDTLIELSRETFQLLKQHWQVVLALAEKLLRRQRMDAQELHEFFMLRKAID